MAYDITFIPGDGVGPEVTNAAKKVLEATGLKFHWETVEAGAAAYEKLGTPLPPSVLDSVRRNRVALKGPVTTPVGYGFRSVNVALRKELDLYTCLRPCKIYPGALTNYRDVDIVVVRENTEDLYAGIEYEEGKPDTTRLLQFLRETNRTVRAESGISLKVISRTATRRLVKFAFEYARAHKRHKVTAVHKANIMKFSDGLWLEVSREVAKKYPDIEFEDRIVDNMCMQLVQKPELYDVLVLPNLYGDILSDLCAGLVGGLGVAPGANIGEKGATFEATHGSAPKYKGLNKVNPTALILSGVLMLRHLGKTREADRLEKAVAETIAEGRKVTYDMKDNRDDPTAVGTSEMADEIIRKIRNSKS